MPFALVTGASRGIGRGIALELALTGHTVYITGRNLTTLNKVVADFQALQKTEKYAVQTGQIIPKICDHSDDAQVDQLFSEIEVLDILINNAYAAVTEVLTANAAPFYTQDIKFWDDVNDVGLRNNYRCCHHAVNKMIKNFENFKSDSPGLICNISSIGGAINIFSTCYSVGKNAKDRMMVDMAIDIKRAKLPRKIYTMSFWPGGVFTETVENLIENEGIHLGEGNQMNKEGCESSRFTGRCLAKILSKNKFENRKFMETLNGKIVQSGDIGQELGVKDIDGRVIYSFFQLKYLFIMRKWNWLAAITPAFVRVPQFLFVLGAFGKRFR